MTEIRQYLARLYPAESDALYARVMQIVEQARTRLAARLAVPPLSERDIVLITYGDSLYQPGEPPLQTLHRFASAYLKNVLSTLHILPFFPYSSDDGFSVTDFYSVNPSLGTWQDIESLGRNFDLMVDAVFNHMSAQSTWFKAFLAGEPEFAGLFFTETPATDLSMVTRPRTTPLLTPFQRPGGDTLHVWTTFSADQVDFDVRTPATLLRLLDILLFYVEKGARIIRLDAIAYLWKEAGTRCIHLPQTHKVIQLMRAVLNAVAPDVILITETNVPHAENISYFGDGYNEAQLVYNFTLPPLLFHTLLTGNADRLTAWAKTLSTPSTHTAFFNFSASHDGIGVRPVEGILTAEELQALVDRVLAQGGRVSYKTNPDGSKSPYELNITYLDALCHADEPVMAQVNRFMVSQAIVLALAGMPAVYIHSLLGSRNNLEGVMQTGENRAINRAKLLYPAVLQTLADETSFRAHIFRAYTKLLRVRRGHPAFHPQAAQEILDLGPGIFGLRRTAIAGSEQILALHNVTAAIQPVDLHRLGIRNAYDLLAGQPLAAAAMQLAPYQIGWWWVE
jgi:glycosidase